MRKFVHKRLVEIEPYQYYVQQNLVLEKVIDLEKRVMYALRIEKDGKYISSYDITGKLLDHLLIIIHEKFNLHEKI